MSFISPLVMLTGVFMTLVPSIPTVPPVTPGTAAVARRVVIAVVLVFGVLGLGFGLGLVNIYLMTNHAR